MPNEMPEPTVEEYKSGQFVQDGENYNFKYKEGNPDNEGVIGYAYVEGVSQTDQLNKAIGFGLQKALKELGKIPSEPGYDPTHQKLTMTFRESATKE